MISKCRTSSRPTRRLGAYRGPLPCVPRERCVVSWPPLRTLLRAGILEDTLNARTATVRLRGKDLEHATVGLNSYRRPDSRGESPAMFAASAHAKACLHRKQTPRWMHPFFSLSPLTSQVPVESRLPTLQTRKSRCLFVSRIFCWYLEVRVASAFRAHRIGGVLYRNMHKHYQAQGFCRVGRREC